MAVDGECLRWRLQGFTVANGTRELLRELAKHVRQSDFCLKFVDDEHALVGAADDVVARLGAHTSACRLPSAT